MLDTIWSIPNYIYFQYRTNPIKTSSYELYKLWIEVEYAK